ncbi:MAG: tRNA epoxyqueuosine(34) reductase QueG [Planctomycetota bacterium]|nr:tRNA epoxyqueuosine(34) reductase QueG [Planctomycetota bacterium]
MSPSLTEQIRRKAESLGFSKCAIAPVGSLAKSDFYQEWIRCEFHGEMAYMARDPERRLSLEKILPGAQSVICVAQNYATSHAQSEDPKRGKISRYAWGEDYHEVIKDKLHLMRRFLEEQGMKAKVCVDTSAVLEKLWARQAGIGWQGKHTNLISRDLGSWYFLGEILTDLPLEYDEVHKESHCGTCTRCIDLCPTDAIVAPFVLDSRKCISYLTIEHRGVIDRDLRARMGSWIYGCDICQDVCPWNKFAQEEIDVRFHPREGNLAPSLIDLLGLSIEGFRERFRKSPIKRAKYPGFLRNVCIALGNSGDPAALPALKKALTHSESLVRVHAAWALGRLGGEEALRERAGKETDPDVLEEISLSLAE